MLNKEEEKLLDNLYHSVVLGENYISSDEAEWLITKLEETQAELVEYRNALLALKKSIVSVLAEKEEEN